MLIETTIITGAFIFETTVNPHVRHQVNAAIIDSVNFIRAGAFSVVYQTIQLSFFINDFIADPYTTLSLFNYGVYTTMPDVGYSLLSIPWPLIACSIRYNIPEKMATIASINADYAKLEENAFMHTLVYNQARQETPQQLEGEYRDMTTRVITNLELIAIKDNGDTEIKTVLAEVFSWQVRWLCFVFSSGLSKDSAIICTVLAKNSKKIFFGNYDFVAVFESVLIGEVTKTWFVETEKKVGASFGGFFVGSQFFISGKFCPLELLKDQVMKSYNHIMFYSYNIIIKIQAPQFTTNTSAPHKVDENTCKSDCDRMALIVDTGKGIVDDNISKEKALMLIDPNSKSTMYFPCAYKTLESIDKNGSWQHDELIVLIGGGIYADLAKMHGLLPNTPCVPPLEI